MKIKEDMRERKVPRPVGLGATGMAEVGAVGIIVSAAILGPLGISVAKEINATSLLCLACIMCEKRPISYNQFVFLSYQLSTLISKYLIDFLH